MLYALLCYQYFNYKILGATKLMCDLLKTFALNISKKKKKTPSAILVHSYSLLKLF